MRKQRERHGKSKSRAYNVWAGIIERCNNPNNRAYKNYGGRGITVCAAWMTFCGFFRDMGDPPEGLTLERIDNDGPYSPDNCRWATRKEQARNQRGQRLVTVNGVTRPLFDWADRTGIALGTLWQRLAKGWSPEEAIGTPLITKRKGIRRGESLRANARHDVDWSDPALRSERRAA